MNYKYDIDFEELNIDLQLYYFGRQDCKSNHHWGPGLKDHYKIHYIYNGKGKFQVGDKIYFLSKGDGFLICPQTVVYYEADSKEPWEYSWVAFNGLNAENYLKQANLSMKNPIFNCKELKVIEDCFEKMNNASKMKRGKDVALQGCIYFFLSLLIEESNNKDLHYAKNTKEIYIKKVIEYIKMNYSRDMRISEIANYIGLDRKYLSTIFKEKLEKTPQQFLMDYRIEKACMLINHGNLSISEVSKSVGYKDPLVFSKLFKKIKGVSPRNFRKLNI